MSDQHLDKLRVERETLSRELKLLQSAIPREAAAEKVVQTLSKSIDPMGGGDNEWVTKNGGGDGGCCSIA